MLEIDKSDLKLVAGDDTTGFYTSKADPPQGMPRCEAYSWGNLDSAPKGGLAALQRAGWLVLLPMALANVAYWAWPGTSPLVPGWRQTARVALLRCAGLLLTALLITTATDIGENIVAWQCFRGQQARCPSLPSWTNFLASPPWADPARRLAIGAVLPLAVLVVMVLLSYQSLQRYEAFPDTAIPTGGNVLSNPKLWRGLQRGRRLQHQHVALGLLVIDAETLWPAWGLDRGYQGWPLARLIVALTVSTLLFVVVAWSVFAYRNEFASDYSGGVTRKLLEAAGATTVVAFGLLLIPASRLDDSASLGGAGAVPLAIAAALVGVVVIAFVSTLRPSDVLLVGSGVIAAAVLVYLRTSGTVHQDTFAVAVLALAVGGFAIQAYRSRNQTLDAVAWHGAAPALLLGAATFVALLYSTCATLLVADHLNGGPSLTSLAAKQPVGSAAGAVSQISCNATLAADKASATCDVSRSAPVLGVPPLYLWLAIAVLGCAIVVVLVLLVGFARFHRFARHDPFDADIGADITADYRMTISDAEAHTVKRARTQAAGFRRIERFIALLACGIAPLILLALAFALTGVEPWHTDVSGGHIVPKWIAQAGLDIAVLTAVGILGLGGRDYRSPKDRRTIGIIWDLSSFWPRTCHPFSPPCYAERTIPDLCVRVDAELQKATHRVVLSGHSLGSVLAVATFMRFNAAERARLSLLTYGCQLRSLFGRLFPTVFGPAVLGNAPTTTPKLGRLDPDAGEHISPPDPPGSTSAAADDENLVALLTSETGVRWRNLWRPSDPLGWPAFAPRRAGWVDTRLGPNTVDVVVREVDLRTEPGNPQPPALRKHSDYPLASQFATALRALIKLGEGSST